MSRILWLSACLLLSPLALAQAPAAPLPLESFLARDDFDQVALSPDGKLLAATVPLTDRTAMVIIRLSDMSRVAALQHGARLHVLGFQWVTPERIMYAMGETSSDSETPTNYGELFAVNADGSDPEMLIGQRAGQDRISASLVKGRQPERIAADLLDVLEDDEDNVLVSVEDLDGSESAFTRVERMNIFSGKHSVVVQGPVRRASFGTDHAGVVRFASGSGSDNRSRLYHRAGDKAEWQLVNDQAETSLNVSFWGFSADNKTAYLVTERKGAPDALEAFDTTTGKRSLLKADDNSDPYELLYSPYDGAPHAVVFMDGLPRVEYFDPEHPASRLHRSLQASFPGQQVRLPRATADGSKGLLIVYSDSNPGDIYLFDHKAKKADFLLANNSRLDPAQMASVTPVSLKARDGLALQGYLTLPRGSSGKGLPLVAYPHGGPMNEADAWGFDARVQLLASRGYAVLQVNYRGSGNHGRDFVLAGYREWGRKMQDDLTDATRWAIAEGIADGGRVCIVGASYGAYAALMGAAREPSLYRCAAGHVGVYDMRTMYGEGNLSDVKWGRNYLSESLGREKLEEISPNLLADRIQAAVLLTAGKDDGQAPARHTEIMRDALAKAGKPVQAHIYPGEGHNFFVEANVLDMHRRLLDFLQANLGPAKP